MIRIIILFLYLCTCMKLNLTIILFLLGLEVQAQTLDKNHLLLDGSLSDNEIRGKEFVFNDVKKAFDNLSDTTTLYVKPWVYWVDNPDDPLVVTGQNGKEPFGMVVKTKKLSIIGLGTDAQDVVFASQRGQMQGAVGNFTMFDFHVDELSVENLTMGNYCNVDLIYPKNTELSRKRRSDAITQAHVGYVHGHKMSARKVRFISRLNLNPLNGAEESSYDSCHFECTDDALNGNAIYRHCDFDLYGQKPFWSTYGHGPLFIDCDFYVKSHNKEIVFCKQGGPVSVSNSRFHAPEDCYIGWTTYPQKWLRCYQHNFALNGRPYVIGNRQPENTVILDSIGQVPFLNISQHEIRKTAPSLFRITSEPGVTWSVTKGFERFATITPVSDERRSGTVEVKLANEEDEIADFCLVATAIDRREAACHIVLQPSVLPPPVFSSKPVIRIKDKVATLVYDLDLQGRRDESRIIWKRDGIPVRVSYVSPQRTYQLTNADAGHLITASIEPRHQRSGFGQIVEVSSFIKSIKKKHAIVEELETDFHDFPTDTQPVILEGYWTVDGYKPADTEEYPWSFTTDKPMWEYGKGFNGAVGMGLLQAQRGARLMYTPLQGNYHDVSLELRVDPTKTAGQGFGSATGQYMDVCIKFDTKTLTGYGLRIIRTVKHSKAVDFLLVEYKNGRVRSLTPSVSATCYRTGCKIKVEYTKGLLSAHVETTTPRPDDSVLPHIVDLSVEVPDNQYGGLHIQHTGSCGESTTMLHQLKARWEQH